MNNVMFPIMAAFALGSNKISNQQSVNAGITSFLGAAMPGNTGVILSAMNAVNAEDLKNKLELSESARVKARRDRSQAESDLAFFIQRIVSADGKSIVIELKAGDEALLDDIIKRRKGAETVQAADQKFQKELIENLIAGQTELIDRLNNNTQEQNRALIEVSHNSQTQNRELIQAMNDNARIQSESIVQAIRNKPNET